jgi:hypothetical protein
MATFTMSLKKAIEITGGSVTVSPEGTTILTGGNIGIQYYPIFDTNYKATLDGKIIDRYWNREIGVESIDMFQLAMRRKMNEIMPFFNKMYLSEKIIFDPLSTVNLKTIGSDIGSSTGASTGNSVSTATADSKSRSVSSETPQTMLSPNGDYATGAVDAISNTKNGSNATQAGSENQSSKMDNVSTTTGYQGVASDLLMRYRDSLLNIDMMIVTELEELFMQVWDNGDSYTNSRGFY